ncbi:hypothetical protein HK098_006114 [Nowakowskiella sp. JEL0407]|nr:hypothetical protein HK098_006114 [Nowakowskiella sp. JEL0407]
MTKVFLLSILLPLIYLSSVSAYCDWGDNGKANGGQVSSATICDVFSTRYVVNDCNSRVRDADCQYPAKYNYMQKLKAECLYGSSGSKKVCKVTWKDNVTVLISCSNSYLASAAAAAAKYTGCSCWTDSTSDINSRRYCTP